MKKTLSLALLTVLLAACTVQVPKEFTVVPDIPDIYPDYAEVTVPVNIAPLNFMYTDTTATAAVTVLTAADGQTMAVKGLKADWNVKQWHALLGTSAGKEVTVSSYLRTADGWKQYHDFSIRVSRDSIDPYISYRLIAPSYVTYEDLTINQRCLEDWDEDVIFRNLLISTDQNGQCINCHNYRHYRTSTMQFHARQHQGGTILVVNGEPRKINLKTDSTLSAGVYPSFHPTHHYIAYSVNNTGQSFHTFDNEKIEVQDISSDLILYDYDQNEVTVIENDTTEWECYPNWSADGRYLYYVSAHYEIQDYEYRERDIIDHYQDFHYDLYRKAFDPDTKHFGPKERVFAASEIGKSVTLPRVSPDGRYLMFTIGDYGVFHIWHRSADLMLMDLEDGSVRNMREINSPCAESFHNWSSSGRWVLFSSRREDSNFTRLYITHVDSRGHGTKPFVLPQRDPEFYHDFFRSYNIPEFMVEPVTITPHEFADIIHGETVQAQYHEQY